MTVDLRKCKITKSVVNQILRGGNNLYYEKHNYTILGWCMLNGKIDSRWILLYRENTNDLVRLPYAQKLKDSDALTQKSVQKGDRDEGYRFPIVYYLNTYFPDFSKTDALEWSEEEDVILSAKENLEQFLLEVNQKGQIFI